uniref:Uncharacterized protein n=1 Tax=Rhizophora mucronata TaxID=61149 RepID=A0A2P2QUC8_RHIMU
MVHPVTSHLWVSLI